MVPEIGILKLDVAAFPAIAGEFMGAGVLIDMQDGEAEWDWPLGKAVRKWGAENMMRLAFTPAEIVAAAVARPNNADGMACGVYFLIWHDRICYVGRGATIGRRLFAHACEGRPFQRVATIVGLREGIAAAVEDAYNEAWSPPWNAGRTKGWMGIGKPLTEALAAMDREAVMPWYVPTLDQRNMDAKQWQQHVIGYWQAHQAGELTPANALNPRGIAPRRRGPKVPVSGYTDQCVTGR